MDFDFTKAFTTSNANTAYSFAYFKPTGGNEVWSDGARRNGLSSINYAISPENVAFGWPDDTPLTTFAAADLLNASPTLRTYRKGTDGLAMEIPFTHVLRVSYENSVSFVRETVAGTLRSQRYSLFFNGVTTTTDFTTDLSYTGTPQIAGGVSGTTAAGVFSSPATTINVAASNKALTGTLRIIEDVNGTPTERAALALSSTVGVTGVFSGTIDDTASGLKGTFVGSLAGPAREEIFLIFNVSKTDGPEYIGSLIGG